MFTLFIKIKISRLIQSISIKIIKHGYLNSAQLLSLLLTLIKY